MTGVLPGANVLATFSEPMEAGSIDKTTVKLVQNGTSKPVAASVKYISASKQAELDPTSSLKRGATYTATVTTGVKDLAGNPMTNAKTWSFTVR